MIDFFLNSLWRLFAPSEGFLLAWQQDISSRFNARMGGITHALSYISSRFSQLREYRDIPGIFEITFPPDSALYGIRWNILAPAVDIISWLRFSLTGVMVLATAFICYRKALAMLSK